MEISRNSSFLEERNKDGIGKDIHLFDASLSSESFESSHRFGPNNTIIQTIALHRQVSSSIESRRNMNIYIYIVVSTQIENFLEHRMLHIDLIFLID